jgi:hypothetical protein
MEFPTEIRLKLDGSKVRDKVGQKLARDVKARLSEGDGADGSLPANKTNSNPPLNATGELIRSVRYNKKAGLVLPAGTRADGKRNMAILAMNIATRPDLEAADPFGVSEEMNDSANAAAEKEIARQLESGECSLLAELKKIR